MNFSDWIESIMEGFGDRIAIGALIIGIGIAILAMALCIASLEKSYQDLESVVESAVDEMRMKVKTALQEGNKYGIGDNEKD